MQQPTIGVLTPFLGGFYFGAVLTGVHSAARAANARVIAIQTAASNVFGANQTFHDRFAWDYIDGWISVVDAATDQYLQQLVERGKPIVMVSNQRPSLQSLAILPDNRTGTASAVRHLLDHNHQRIAFVGYLGQDDIRQRYEGYRDALATAGVASEEEDFSLVFPAVDNSEEGGYRAANLMLKQGALPSAVVAATDLNAIGLIRRLQEEGVRVPQDLAVVGFDDIEMAETFSPPLTSVRQHVALLGSTAVQQLLDQLQGAPPSHSPIYVTTSLIVRESCGCTPARAAAVDEQVAQQQAWEERYGRELAAIALAPFSPEPVVSSGASWPGAATLLRAVRANVEGAAPPPAHELDQAWLQATRVSSHVEPLFDMVDLLEQAGAELLARQTHDAEAPARLNAFLKGLTRQLMREHVALRDRYQAELERTLRGNYEISMRMLLGEEHKVLRDLSWLYWTSVEWGCLALYDQSASEQQLTVIGTYKRESSAPSMSNVRCLPEAFPPLDLLPETLFMAGANITGLIPIRTAMRDWGVLSIIGPLDTRSYKTVGALGQLAALLGGTLTRAELQERLRSTNRALSSAKETAEEANRLKTQFVANMSHELRTPLNAIINFTRFLGDPDIGGSLNEQQRLFGQRVLANADHLLGLINDILDLAKIEAGKMDIFPDETDLLPLLQGVMSTAIGLTKDKGLELDLEVEPNLPLVWIDKTRIRQVLLNLLSNAAKFTRAGGITVRVARDEGDMVRVAVADTGIGIPPEKQHLVFEEYRQIEGELLQQHTGTGLGMPISKRFVELHGGQMWLESTPGVGSTFSFTLPTTQPQLEAALSAERRPAERPAAPRPLVLIVDDQPQHHEQLCAPLAEHGYRVQVVQDGAAALAAIRAESPALVLLSTVIAERESWRLLGELKRDPVSRLQPTLLFSWTPDLKLDVFLGATWLWLSPPAPEEVLATTARWVKARGSLLVVCNDQELQDLLSAPLRDAGYQVSAARNSKQGLAMFYTSYPEMVVVDLGGLRQDGYDMITHLRTDFLWKDLPIVVLLPSDGDPDGQEWRAGRALQGLQKIALTHDELLPYVQRWIDPALEQRQLFRS